MTGTFLHNKQYRGLTRGLIGVFLAATFTLQTAGAVDPFAGVTGLEIGPADNKEQVIRFASDLPFEYELEILNTNQVLLRLLNARLSNRLITEDGLITIVPGGHIQHVMLRADGNPDTEEIVLSGPDLGKKTLVVEGAAPAKPSQVDEPVEIAPIEIAMTGKNLSGSARTPALSVPELTLRLNKKEVLKKDLPKPRKVLPEKRSEEMESRVQNTRKRQIARRGKSETVSPNYDPLAEKPRTIAVAKKPLVILPSTSEYEHRLVRTPADLYAEGIEPDQEMLAMLSMGEAMSETIQPRLNRQPEAVPEARHQPSNALVRQLASPVGKDEVPRLAQVAMDPAAGQEAPAQQPRRRLEMQPRVQTTRGFAPDGTPETTNYGPQIATVRELPYRYPIGSQGKTIEMAPSRAEHSPPDYNDGFTIPEPQAQMMVDEVPRLAPEKPAPEKEKYGGIRRIKALPTYQGGGPPIQFTLGTTGQTYTLPGGTPSPDADLRPQGDLTNVAFNMLAYDSPVVASLMNDALGAYRNNRISEARRKIEHAIELNPNGADLYAALGELEITAGNYAAAGTAYGKAAAINSKYRNRRYAELLILNGEPDQALDMLEAVIQDNPKDAQGLYMLGTLYEKLGRSLKALPLLKRAESLDPDNADLQYNLGLAYEFTGDMIQARNHYLRGIRLNPGDAQLKQALKRVQR